MNWTGGALSRSRNARVSLSEQQRNYFAKNRGKLQNPRPPRPKIEFFEIGSWNLERSREAPLSNPTGHRGRAPSQRTLDEFENVEPVVRQLKSLRPRLETKKRKRTPLADIQSLAYKQPNDHASQFNLPVSSSFAPSSESRLKDQVIPPRESSGDDKVPLWALSTIEDRKRKLLQTDDWTGIKSIVTQPVKITFIEAEDRDLIGRRRKSSSTAVKNGFNEPTFKRKRMEPRVLHPGVPGEYCSVHNNHYSVGEPSIRIGSAVDRMSLSDEMLCEDTQGSPFRRAQNPLHLGHAIDSHNAEPALLPEYYRREEPTKAASMNINNDAEPFRSLFSPEECTESAITQLQEAAGNAEVDYRLVSEEDRLLLNNYRPAEPKPGFRLVFEDTPQPHCQSSDVRSPIARDFAFLNATGRSPSKEEIPLPDADRALHKSYQKASDSSNVTQNSPPSLATSPLSIANMQYLAELENQVRGYRGQETFQDLVHRCVNRGNPLADGKSIMEPERGGTENQKRPSHAYATTAQGRQDPHVTADEESELWQNLTTMDNVHQMSTGLEQLVEASMADHNLQPLSKNANERKEAPVTSPYVEAPKPIIDEELKWRAIIFSDDDDKNEWIIEEPLPAPSSSLRPYAQSQPSMIAEAATSPIKRNPHLGDKTTIESTPVTTKNSRSSQASTSPAGNPYNWTTSSSSLQQAIYPTDPSSETSSPQTYPSPSTFSMNSPNSSNPILPPTSVPSSLAVQASVTTTHRDTLPVDISSDELLRKTPTRVLFRRPARYSGEYPSGTAEPICLGKKVAELRRSANGGKGRRRVRVGRVGDGDDIVDD